MQDYFFEKQTNPDRLTLEITQSDITIALSHITTLDATTTVWFKAELPTEDEAILAEIIQNHINSPLPEEILISRSVNESFTSKKLVNGKSLFVRNHGYPQALIVGENTIEITIPYAHCKINELEVIGSEIGDTVSFKVLDSENGDYTTIPKFQLNQFAFDLNLSKDHYRKHCSYDADLYMGMIILIEYNSKSEKDVGVNIVLHEVKD